jgi:hypothetical protein
MALRACCPTMKTMHVEPAPKAQLTDELRPPLTPVEALLEADRGLACGGSHAPAPCAAACPAEIDVPGFIESLAVGDRHGAARTIFAENLPGRLGARAPADGGRPRRGRRHQLLAALRSGGRTYRLTHVPERRQQIQAQVDADWAELAARCG